MSNKLDYRAKLTIYDWAESSDSIRMAIIRWLRSEIKELRKEVGAKTSQYSDRFTARLMK